MRAAWRDTDETAAPQPQPRSGASRRPVMLPVAVYPDWNAIYADNVGRIYRLMFAKVGNRPDAEDLTSQVFLAAYGPLRATAGVGQVRGYLTATARTVLAEHWRRTLGHQVTQIDPQTTDLEDYGGAMIGADPHGRDEARERDRDEAAGEHAERILRALPERQRRILVLRFLRGYTVRQAAAELGVSVANAKVLQHRALRAAAGLEQSAQAAEVNDPKNTSDIRNTRSTRNTRDAKEGER